MSAADTIRKALDEHPEVRTVLEIAARARQAEAKEPAREIGTSAEVIVVPTHVQGAI